jgi:hypothetical protein
MKTRCLLQLISVLFLLMMVLLTGFQSLAASSSEPCQPSRTMKLAMDQRDDFRLKCLRHRARQTNVAQCLQIAKSMEYTSNADEARGECVGDMREHATIKECIQISKSMQYADTGDDVRWDCLTRLSKRMSKKTCEFFADSMSYPANVQRAKIFCDNELR